MRTLLQISMMAICYLLVTSSTTMADYSQGGSLLSWEWLTDVSDTIVVGTVAKVDASGNFKLRIDNALKQPGSKFSAGDIVDGGVLGHAIPHFRNLGDPSMAHELQGNRTSLLWLTA